MMDIDSMIAVLQAAKEGKPIEVRGNGSATWNSLIGIICPHETWSHSCNEPPMFNFGIYDYRVKPEPREWWIVQSKIEENFNVHAFRDLRDAENYNLGYWGKKPIKVREVIE
jgi:hypothetical protein